MQYLNSLKIEDVFFSSIKFSSFKSTEGEKGVNVLDEIHYGKISPMALAILFLEAPFYKLQRRPSNGSMKVPNGPITVGECNDTYIAKCLVIAHLKKVY